MLPALLTLAVWLPQDVLFEVPGDQAQAYLGYGLRGGLDFDGDTVPDLLVSEYARDEGGLVNNGRVRVLSGQDGHELRSYVGVNGEQLGRGVDWLEDLSGDGVPELLLGTILGRVYVLSGADGTILRTHNAVSDGLGFGVRSAGDLDGDAIGDYLLGADQFNGTGEVRAFSGASGALLYTVQPPSTAGLFGRFLDRLGDVDGDGVEDFIGGAPAGRGATVVFSGVDGTVIHTRNGLPGYGFGSSVGGGGDLDGDGVPDFIATAPGADLGGDNTGLIVAYSGATGFLLWSQIGTPTDHVAGSVNLLPDVNGDGRDDFATCGVLRRRGVWEGVARLRSGATGEVIYQFESPDQDHPFLSAHLEDVGDLDGDGRVDLAVTAYATDAQGIPDSGSLVVYRGDDLFVNANVKRVFAGEFLSFTAAEGLPGKPCVLYEKIVGGPPAAIKDIGRFDALGRFTLAGTMPPGYAGLDIVYTGLALNAANKVIATGQERVELR